MATKKKADSVDQAEPTFSKEQLVKSETLGLPRDAVAAILKTVSSTHGNRRSSL